MPDSALLGAGDPRLAATGDLAVARLAVDTAAGTDGDHRIGILGFLATHPDALHRTCVEGHLTGSALVVDPLAGRTLVLLHAKLGRWLQPGGHADGNANLASVALREATEETGIEGLRVAVPAIDVDIHKVEPPGEPPHLHLDVRHLVVAPPGADVVLNDESHDARWVSRDELGLMDADEGLLRLADNGFALARQLVADGVV